MNVKFQTTSMKKSTKPIRTIEIIETTLGRSVPVLRCGYLESIHKRAAIHFGTKLCDKRSVSV